MFLFLFCFFKDRVSLYSPGQSGTHDIYQTSLQLQLSSGIKACATKPAQRSVFVTILSHQRLTGHAGFKPLKELLVR